MESLMSVLAWIDFDETERSRMQRLLALFQEQETRDELGLGSIRDYLSDRFFPGTSTIQTRLRYMLFVPWILRGLESRNGSKEQLANEGRSAELRLIEALKAGGETGGVIGSSAGNSLQRLPSSTYWAGLGHWGIRRFDGSMEAYFQAIPLLRDRRRRDAQDTEQGDQVSYWHPSLPERPSDLLDACSFALTSEEAEFIRDRLTASHPKSLMAWLAQRRDGADADAIWQHPSLSSFPAAQKVLIHHAHMVSEVLHGAALIYNLLLAERTGAAGGAESKARLATEYRETFAAWADALDMAAVRAWQPEALLSLMAEDGAKVHPFLASFFLSWKKFVEASPHALVDDAGARTLVQHREQQLKGSQSRFTNAARLQTWSGASGTRPLSFRWHQAQSHLKDLADAA
jgi:hypothetical protein